MGTNTVVEEFVATNYGMTAKANIEGTALSCTEEFKRVDPIVSGFYVFDSQVGEFLVQHIQWKFIFFSERIRRNNKDYFTHVEVFWHSGDETRLCIQESRARQIVYDKRATHRITETAGGITMEKRKGDHKAVTSIILDQEYSYSEPGGDTA